MNLGVVKDDVEGRGEIDRGDDPRCVNIYIAHYNKIIITMKDN